MSTFDFLGSPSYASLDPFATSSICVGSSLLAFLTNCVVSLLFVCQSLSLLDRPLNLPSLLNLIIVSHRCPKPSLLLIYSTILQQLKFNNCPLPESTKSGQNIGFQVRLCDLEEFWRSLVACITYLWLSTKVTSSFIIGTLRLG